MKIGKNTILIFHREIFRRRKFWRFDRGIWPHNKRWSPPIFKYRNFGPFEIRIHLEGEK